MITLLLLGLCCLLFGTTILSYRGDPKTQYRFSSPPVSVGDNLQCWQRRYQQEITFFLEQRPFYAVALFTLWLCARNGMVWSMYREEALWYFYPRHGERFALSLLESNQIAFGIGLALLLPIWRASLWLCYLSFRFNRSYCTVNRVKSLITANLYCLAFASSTTWLLVWWGDRQATLYGVIMSAAVMFMVAFLSVYLPFAPKLTSQASSERTK